MQEQYFKNNYLFSSISKRKNTLTLTKFLANDCRAILFLIIVLDLITRDFRTVEYIFLLLLILILILYIYKMIIDYKNKKLERMIFDKNNNVCYETTWLPSKVKSNQIFINDIMAISIEEIKNTFSKYPQSLLKVSLLLSNDSNISIGYYSKYEKKRAEKLANKIGEFLKIEVKKSYL